MIEVKIRYNTVCDDNHLFWRVIIDGKEYIASNVIIEIPTHTTRDLVWDNTRNTMVDKHHITALANEIVWKGDVVIIK
jgi:hypothetical protein